MRKWSLLLVMLALSSSRAFAQDNPASPANGSAGYINCPAGQSNVFLYQTVTTFEVLSSPRCGDQVEILGRVDTWAGICECAPRTARGLLCRNRRSPRSRRPSLAYQSQNRHLSRSPRAKVLRWPAHCLMALRASVTTFPEPKFSAGIPYLNEDWENFANRSGMQGWDAAATINVYPWLGVEGNVGGNYQRNCIGAAGLTCFAYTFMGGPKITAYRSGNITAFGHGLVGLGGLTMTLAGSPLTWRDLAWAAGGGVDYALTNRISVRFGPVDYLRTQYMQSLGGTHQSNIRVSAGVVLRIGSVIAER